jgi:predicted metal-dependent hydrolase
MKNEIIIRRQRRKSLAMHVTPAGVEVRIPEELDPEGEAVQTFIAKGLAKLDQPLPEAEGRTTADLRQMVKDWSKKLDVTVGRVQVRMMRNKWASMSERGNLTLADELLEMPAELVDYVLVHELVHVKIPDHGQGFQVTMDYIFPGWKDQDLLLGAWMMQNGAGRTGRQRSGKGITHSSE